MHPEYVIIFIERGHPERIVNATIAYTWEEVEKIIRENEDSQVYARTIPVDYSIREE
jgi:hypothetical protein